MPKKRPMLIAVDFDGTIVRHAFPDIGDPLPDAFRVLKRINRAGHHIILWTCREDDSGKERKHYLEKAVKFLKDNGIGLRSVNENLQEDDFREPPAKSRKVFANVYIDDRNFGGFPGWKEVEKWMEKEGWL